MGNADTSDISLLDSPITDDATPQDDPQPELSEEEKLTKRVAYWQSRADKFQREAQDNALGAPYARLFQEKPELALVVQAELAKPKGDQDSSGLKKPEPPARPVEFNEVESYNNPESDSFKFRKAQEAYREQHLAYLGETQLQRTKVLEEELNRRRTDEDSRIKVAQLKTIVMQKGLTAAETEDFVVFMSDPKNMTTDNLVALYKLKKAPQPAADAKEEEMRRRAMGGRAPVPPISGGGGVPGKPMDPAVSFSQSLIAKARRK
jgi:hypothetical protein